MAAGRLIFRLSLQEQAIMAFTATFSNTVLLGIPIIYTAFGERGMLPVTLITSFHSIILLTLATTIIEIGRGQGGKVLHSLPKTLGALLRNPLLLAIAAGFVTSPRLAQPDRHRWLPRPACRRRQVKKAQVELDPLLCGLRACTFWAAHLPLGPRPVVRGHASARLMITSQAPGTRVHETGLSFNDRSGDVLRSWLAVDRDTFYDEARIAIMPMGFCYPGRDKKGGDLPPRKECAPLWHARLLPLFPAVRLNLLG